MKWCFVVLCNLEQFPNYKGQTISKTGTHKVWEIIILCSALFEKPLQAKWLLRYKSLHCTVYIWGCSLDAKETVRTLQYFLIALRKPTSIASRIYLVIGFGLFFQFIWWYFIKFGIIAIAFFYIKCMLVSLVLDIGHSGSATLLHAW